MSTRYPKRGPATTKTTNLIRAMQSDVMCAAQSGMEEAMNAYRLGNSTRGAATMDQVAEALLEVVVAWRSKK